MSPDLNPIEHVWGMLDCWVQAVEPPLQTLLQLEASLHREWRQLPQLHIRRLTGGLKSSSKHVVVTLNTEL